MTLHQGREHFHGILCEAQRGSESWLKAILESKIDFPDANDAFGWFNFYAKAKSIASKFASGPVRELVSLLANPHMAVDAIVIRDLPHEDPGQSPVDGKRPTGKNPVSEYAVVGLASLGGFEIYGHPQEKKGDQVHQVAPSNEKEHSQSNEGRPRFDFHTDNAFLKPFQPAVLFLIGLVNKNVATLVLSLDQIIQQTPAEMIAALRQPIFEFKSPESFDFGTTRIVAEQRPIIYRDEYGIDRITLPGSTSNQSDEQAAKILKEFRQHLDSLSPSMIVVGPGMVLAFRNDRVVHGREMIPEESARWLQRIYATVDISSFREAVGSKDLTFSFDARVLVGN